MSTVKIDRSTHFATFKKCKNLGQLIAAIEKEGERKNLFVVKMSLNGRKMDSEEENLLESLGISEVEYIEVEWSNIKDIVRDSIATTIQAIQETQARSIRFANDFRKAGSVDDEKTKYILIQCRSIMESLEEIFQSHITRKFHIRHHSLWLEAEKEFTNILQVILQSRNVAKPDFMADLLEYDLVQTLDQWEEALERELIDNPSFSGIFHLKTTGAGSNNGVDV